MTNQPIINLYGAERCHKSKYYKALLEKLGLSYHFLDVEIDEAHARQLKALYENKKLNFPTITIGAKKLRNPTEKELVKWVASS